MTYITSPSPRRLATISTVLIVLVAFCNFAWADKEAVLHTFTGGSDGGYPSSFLVSDGAGNLYGTAGAGGIVNVSAGCYAGCGLVFEMSPNGSGGWTETVLYNFQGGTDGIFPRGVVFGADGNLYGTTGSGGLADCGGYTCGTIFKLTHNSNGTWTESVLYSFTGGADGAQPVTTPIVDSAGNIYGTTSNYGLSNCSGGCGLVYELSPTSSGSYTYSVRYSFTGGADGSVPWASLTMDRKGNLYGTTWQGGNAFCFLGCGAVWELSPSGSGQWSLNVLHSFTGGADGGFSESNGVILDAAGNLYGATFMYGANGRGVVYKLSPTSSGEWQQTILQSFPTTTTAAYPNGTLVFDSAGNLYGPASGNTYGTVYRLTPTSSGEWKLTTLYHGFNGNGLGWGPTGPVVLGPSPTIFGTTLQGGVKNLDCRHGCGVFFELSK